MADYTRDIFGDAPEPPTPPPNKEQPTAPQQPDVHDPVLKGREPESDIPTEPFIVQSEPPPPPTDNRELDDTIRKLFQRKREGKKIIAVIGFSDSGKSFYINRLRKDLPTYDGWMCRPAAEQQIFVTTAGMFETNITKAVKGKETGYVIMDVAGESFRKGFETQNDMLDTHGAIPIDDVYLAIIALADAYMLFIPAKDLHKSGEFEGKDRDRKALNQTMADAFHNIIGLIKIAHQRITLNGEDPQNFLRTGVTGQELEQVFHGHQHTSPKPISILYSQADLYEGTSNDPKTYDADPFLFTFRRLPALAYPINRFFDYYRFDFLSAFYGLDRNSNIPNYDLAAYGAIEAFYWIHENLQTRHSLLGPIQRWWKGYLPTRKAIFWRKRFDPAFKREWKSFGI